jgi:hypothetical protein
MALWKSVENFLGLAMRTAVGRKPLVPVFCGLPGGLAQSLRACSACAGDYEDPDRTAWAPDEEEDDLAQEKAQDGAQEKVENGAGVEGKDDDDANGDEFPA